MNHYWSLEEVSLPDSWLTIGSFDGVHRGHQVIIHQLVENAHKANLPAATLTFFPHPSIVLRNRKEPFYLTTPEERAALLGSMGVDLVITHPFTKELAAKSALEFMASVRRYLHPSHILVGYDFALGRDREGDVNKLKELGDRLGYHLDVIRPIQMAGEIISSSQIRTALFEGNINKVNQLLDRPYSLSGEVVLGDGRGRKLGIPTANLAIWFWKALPKAGVYACEAIVDGETWPAVVNIGVRPTFESGPVQPRVEAHLIDLDRDLYEKRLELEFIERLRNEQRFPDVEALVAQIHMDIQQAKAYLA
jgi:riboflavin kinase / FMN adenylyltransferase